MKNRRWLRLTGWLMALVMILTIYPIATFAEGDGEVNSDTIKSPTMQKRPTEVDISSDAAFTYKNAKGTATKPAAMDPNEANYMTLTVSGLNDHNEIINETVMAVTLPENIMVMSELEGFSSDAVNATLDNGRLLLSWKGEKQDSFEATVAVLPHMPTDNDLSGSYVLGTGGNQYYKVMLGTIAFKDTSNSKRMRLSGIAFEEVNEKVNILSDDVAPVWELKHISGNYYTVCSKENGKYLRIDANNNGLILEDATLLSAQKLLLESVGNGYYSFRFGNKSINNSSFSVEKGFASYGYEKGLNAILKLYNPSAVLHGQKLVFSVNGGTGDTDPETILAETGTEIILPNLNATKNGQNFIGWADVKDFYSQVPGTNHRYHDLYKAGTAYTIKSGSNTLYAVYNPTVKTVQFGIRKDGVIMDEPNGYDVKNYIGHFKVDGILKEGHWVIDINATKPVNGYYVDNDVIAALNWAPSAEEIAAALKKEGNVDFDPETQYIHYYVLKCTSATVWKVDGVIRNKTNVEITYDANVPGTEKTKVKNLPGGYQVAPGTDIKIGADENSTDVKRPIRDGYFFAGWNTEKDGSGTYYSENNTVHMTGNLYLYAQWISESDKDLMIRIHSDWPKGKIGYVGASITLTSELTGFDGMNYTLQWQYTTDGENWTDVPDAHDITYTYTLDETTTHYTWRVVAQDIY